uniref:Putative mitochondrial dna polymerase accessory subunit n=2 Tax=Rhodnius TaxID=13248 RepID=R4G8F3_RHOPR
MYGSNSSKMLKLIINHFDRSSYVNFKVNVKKVERYMYGPPGELLAENIRREWLYNVALFREINVLPFHSGETTSGLTKDNLEKILMAKEFNNSELPFGLVESRSEAPNFFCLDPVYPKKTTILRYLGFLKPSEAEQFYYRWQLQRKRWWRKFSNDPGKFVFAESDDTKDGLKNHSKIVAKFPWGDHEVETIQYHGANMFNSLSGNLLNRLYIKDGVSNKYLPHVVESWCSLDYATWTYLCDAYFQEAKEEKPVIRLHKKLAPFKFTAAAPSTTNDKVKQLLDLSHLIMLELRKEGISCLLPVTPPFGTTDLESQLVRSNTLAIPYTAVLTSDSLQTGIFGLYSRETTLQEQVHLSKIKEYGQILMKA